MVTENRYASFYGIRALDGIVKETIIDTFENYYHLDETGNLYINGILTKIDVLSIRLIAGTMVMVWEKLRRRPDPDDQFLEDLLRKDKPLDRDYFHMWTTGNKKPITVGDATIGFIDGDLDSDYKVIITQQGFASKIVEFHDEEGNRRHVGTEGPAENKVFPWLATPIKPNFNRGRETAKDGYTTKTELPFGGGAHNECYEDWYERTRPDDEDE
jgi:hypothetical protein